MLLFSGPLYRLLSAPDLLFLPILRSTSKRLSCPIHYPQFFTLMFLIIRPHSFIGLILCLQQDNSMHFKKCRYDGLWCAPRKGIILIKWMWNLSDENVRKYGLIWWIDKTVINGDNYHFGSLVIPWCVVFTPSRFHNHNILGFVKKDNFEDYAN